MSLALDAVPQGGAKCTYTQASLLTDEVFDEAEVIWVEQV